MSEPGARAPAASGRGSRENGSGQCGLARGGLLYCMVVAAFGALGLLAGSRSDPPATRSITLRARQWEYEPAVIHANLGDTLRLRFGSEDVVHGFYLEGHDLDAAIVP
ncbi:hypothetical protein ACFL59_02810, partial [Planctomycetota bacterium]